jgi:hypothetical protein
LRTQHLGGHSSALKNASQTICRVKDLRGAAKVKHERECAAHGNAVTALSLGPFTQ